MSGHWAQQNERGTPFFLRLTAWMVRCLPLWCVRAATWWVCLYFWLTSRRQRGHIRAYQQRLRSTFPDVKLPEWGAVFSQFSAFGSAITDRFAVWQHKIVYADLVLDDPDDIYGEIRRGGRGQIFLCSHLGNIEVCRALAGHHQGFKMNVLVHSRHAEAFNRVLKEAGADDLNMIQVSDLDVAAMMVLSEKIEQGEWLAVAADRVPVRGAKTVSVPFLGAQAEFPQGAWLLAHLLKAKTNTVFVCRQADGRYRLSLRKFQDAPQRQRGRRDEAVIQSARQYAAVLERYAAEFPLQWFNFYDFWNDNDG